MKYTPFFALFASGGGHCHRVRRGTHHVHGSIKLFSASRLLFEIQDSKRVAAIMSGADIVLFSVVLLIFAYSIALGLVLDLTPEDREQLVVTTRLTMGTNIK